MYLCSIKDMTQDDLFSIGVGKFERKLFDLGLSDGDAVIIRPDAFRDFEGELSPVLTNEIMVAIHNYENKFVAGNELGKYVGDENNGHFLSLRIRFGSKKYTAKELPEFRNVGVNFKTLFPYGENAVLWTRDAYFNFIMDYMSNCKSMPEYIYNEITSNYDSTKIESILSCIEQANEWYHVTFNQLFVNTVMNDPYEGVLEIVKNVFQQYKFGDAYTRQEDPNLSVLIEPMRYGNKDNRSGYCIVDTLPASMDIDSYDVSNIRYEGAFYPRAQKNPLRGKKFGNLSIDFSNDNYGFGELAESDAKMFSTLLLQHEMKMASAYGMEIKNSVIKEVLGLRIHFVIESGRAYPVKDSLIPRFCDDIIDACDENSQLIKATDYNLGFSDEAIMLKETFQKLLMENEIDKLFSGGTLVSLLYDLAPQAEREIKLIKRILSTDCSKFLLDIIKNKRQGTECCSQKLIELLKDEWLNDEAISEILFVFDI